MITHTRIALFIIVGLVAGSIFLFGAASRIRPTAAQGNDFAGLLLRLNQRAAQDSSFVFTIVLSQSPNPQFSEVQIGAGGSFDLAELGSDYLCVHRVASADRTRTCVPFSSISGIGFLQ